jgi:hypothetical protein
MIKGGGTFDEHILSAIHLIRGTHVNNAHAVSDLEPYAYILSRWKMEDHSSDKQLFSARQGIP